MPPDEDTRLKAFAAIASATHFGATPAQIGHAIQRGTDRRQLTGDAEAVGFAAACDLVARGFVCTTSRNRFVLSAFLRRQAR